LERYAASLTSIVVLEEGRALDQVHRFIWRLLADQEFRQLALGDTAAALGQFQLSATEQGSLYRLCMRLRVSQDPFAQQVAMAWYWVM
jgi:hypothetical protein